MAISIVLAACGSEATDTAVTDTAATDTEATDNAPTTRPPTVPSTPPQPTSTQPTSTQPTSTQPNTAQPTSTQPTTTTSPSTTTAPPSTAQSSDAGPAPGCRRLADFDDDLGDWSIVNDGVMGGRSAGFVEVGDSVMRFDGTIVTAGGGFTSVRRRLDAGELTGTTRVEMRIRSDERGYAVILESDERIDGRSVSYRADLNAGETDDDGFAVVSASYADMDTSIFGFRVDAAPFDPDEGREVGIIISDGLDGDFSLDVDWIDVCDG